MGVSDRGMGGIGAVCFLKSTTTSTVFCAFSTSVLWLHKDASGSTSILKVQIGVTSDGKTIVCHHPAADVPYELTQPIERPDPLTNQAETHDQVLKAHLSKEVLQNKTGPTIEELSKMFFTTKHRFYPFGQ
uniref:Large ribosomal subunit protein mL42 n=1 Tax=Nothobranchius furzeri TaxID=105023 RepID=A0A8C6KU25_NOTFU